MKTPEKAPMIAVQSIIGCKKGFTLIELLIVMTIVGILASIAVPNYKWGIIKAKEAVLREDLYNLRTTIDNYYADLGKYPDSLQDLKPKYMRDIPKDPFTGAADWIPVPPTDPEAKGAVSDVKSASPLISPTGQAYSDW